MTYELPEDGWLRLWRRLLTKKSWTESKPKHKVIMITLLMMVNYEPLESEWDGKSITLKPGSMITSLEDIREAAGKEISIQNVRSALDNFEKKYEFIIQQTTMTGRLITILNWKEYQQAGLTAQQSEELKQNAEKLYDYYVEKIKPEKKSKARSISNILKHAKKFEFKDLARAVLNYLPKAMAFDPTFRKDPANFFGVNEPYFKDFMPGKFIKDEVNGNSIRTQPAELTPERLKELNA